MRTGIHLEDCPPEYLRKIESLNERVKNPLTGKSIKIKPPPKK